MCIYVSIHRFTPPRLPFERYNSNAINATTYLVTYLTEKQRDTLLSMNLKEYRINTTLDLEAYSMTFALEVICFCETHYLEFIVAESIDLFKLKYDAVNQKMTLETTDNNGTVSLVRLLFSANKTSQKGIG